MLQHMHNPATAAATARPDNVHPSRSPEEANAATAAGLGAVPKEFRCGYEYWLASNMLEFTSEAYSTTLYDGDDQPVSLPGYRADACTDAAIRYVHEQYTQQVAAARAGRTPKPFFLFISFIEPHHQNRTDDYPAPTGYQEAMQQQLWTPPDLAELSGSTANQMLAGYYGMVKRLDECLGRLQDSLRSLPGLEQNTILMQTCDHGCHFKTRNDEYKRSCHESSIRIPTAICGGAFEHGGKLTAPITLLDFAPSLLDACGVPVPAAMQGKSVLPLMGSRRATDPELEWPSEAFGQISEAQIGRFVRTARWKYGVDAPASMKAHYLEPIGSGSMQYEEQYLYDLQTDPYELRNLVAAPTHGRVREVMRGRLLRRMVEAGEAEPTVVVGAQAQARGQGIREEEAWM